MKSVFKATAFVLVAVLALAMAVSVSPTLHAYAVSGEQVLLGLKFIKDGAIANTTTGVLQTAEASSMSAAIANTATKFATAPSSGSTYIRGVIVEKVSGATSTVTIQTGTGTNCGTGTATLLGPITNLPIGFLKLGVFSTAAKDTCIVTDAAGTVVRALYN